MITHFVYVGAHGIFQVSSWKSFFAFYLLIFTEDEVSMEFKSENVIGSFLSNFHLYFRIYDLAFCAYTGARDVLTSL